MLEVKSNRRAALMLAALLALGACGGGATEEPMLSELDMLPAVAPRGADL